MTRLRFNLAQVMASVLFIGFGFAALRNADGLYASAAFALALLTVSVALAGACSRKGRARMPWAGFAAAGGLYLGAWLWTSLTNIGIEGPPRHVLFWLQPYINPAASGGTPYIAFGQVSRSLEVVLVGCIGAIAGRILAPTEERAGS